MTVRSEASHSPSGVTTAQLEKMADNLICDVEIDGDKQLGKFYCQINGSHVANLNLSTGCFVGDHNLGVFPNHDIENALFERLGPMPNRLDPEHVIGLAVVGMTCLLFLIPWWL